MAPRVTVGVSLKMYFGHRQAIDWCRSVRALSESHPAVADGSVGLFVIPSFVAIAPAVAELAGTPVVVGAQDLFSEDRGAYTGEVSGAELAEAGARVVEVGHAERRRLFGETEEVVAAKTAAALRNGLTPVLCIGEAANTGAGDAVVECERQLSSALDGAPAGPVIDRMVLQRFPENHQDIPLRRFDALVDLVALKTLGFGNHLFEAALDGGVEFGLLTRLDADVGEFENHDWFLLL